MPAPHDGFEMSLGLHGVDVGHLNLEPCGLAQRSSFMSSRIRLQSTKVTSAETILVVEPDILMRMVICEYLRECGYKVIETTGAKEAIAILKAGTKVHAALCAVQLPDDLDGFGLAQWIRANHPRVDVMLVNGATMAANKAGDLCEEGPLGRPYHPDQVVKRLKFLFAKRRRAQR